MAIPYNPSSFATNKTILQAIEELKNYLKNNPCYKVYYVNTAYVVGTYTYNLSDVDDPDDTMTAGDIVFFNNSYYASVINKDTNTFDIDPAVSFKGATGSAGADGVSVSGATINASGHLIITLSDGNTIDAGSVVISYQNTVEITSSSGTLSLDDYNKLLSDDSHILYGGMYYYKYSEGSSILNFVSCVYGLENTHRYMVQITKSTRAYTLTDKDIIIKSDNVNSDTATSGQVLTADGNGGASWTTVSSGYENTVSISTTSGTFSDSDFAKLGYGDSTIVYTDAYSVSTVYKLKLETASILEFECIDAASKNNLKLIDVNKSTKVYSSTSVAMIKSATFDSGTATSGKVLTANGSGGTSWETASASSIEGTSVKSTGESSGKVLTSDGSGNASWQTAGGGGSTKYLHHIYCNAQDGSNKIFFNVQIINETSTAITTRSALLGAINDLVGASYKLLISGTYNNGSSNFNVIHIYSSAGLQLGYINTAGTLSTITYSSSWITNTVSDLVQTL